MGAVLMMQERVENCRRNVFVGKEAWSMAPDVQIK